MKKEQIKLIRRNNNRVIENEWLYFLYDEVLLYCETETDNFEGYNLNKNPFLNKLQDEIGFTLISKMNDAKVGQIDTFYYSKGYGKIEGFFRHLRNAIAHNRIFLKEDKVGLIIEDANNNQLTMYAEVSSFNKLQDIIKGIKRNKKRI